MTDPAFKDSPVGTLKPGHLLVVVLLHSSIYFVQCTSTTGSTAASVHDATTTLCDTNALRFDRQTFTSPHLVHIIVAKI